MTEQNVPWVTFQEANNVKTILINLFRQAQKNNGRVRLCDVVWSVIKEKFVNRDGILHCILDVLKEQNFIVTDDSGHPVNDYAICEEERLGIIKFFAKVKEKLKRISQHLKNSRDILDTFYKNHKRFLDKNRNLYDEVLSGEFVIQKMQQIQVHLETIYVVFSNCAMTDTPDFYNNIYYDSLSDFELIVHEFANVKQLSEIESFIVKATEKELEASAFRIWTELNELDYKFQQICNVLTDNGNDINSDTKQTLYSEIFVVRNLLIAMLNEFSRYCSFKEKVATYIEFTEENLYITGIEHTKVCSNETLMDYLPNQTRLALEKFDFGVADTLADLSLPEGKALYEKIKAKYIQEYFEKELNFKINTEQAIAIANTSQNVLITARAGSGKTRTIISKAMFALKKEHIRPEELIILTFNKNAADEVKNRIVNEYTCSEFREKTAKTFHSFACSILRHYQSPVFDDIVNKKFEYTELIAKLMDPGKYANFHINSLDNVKDKELLEIVNFISFAKKMCLSPDDILALLQEKVYNEDTRKFIYKANNIYRKYIVALSQMHRTDFDYIMRDAIRYIHSTHGNCSVCLDGISKIKLKDLRLILIDEYQDFSKLFYMMIDAIKKYNSELRLFCVGDDWQAINGFAGSSLEYFKHYERYFNNSSRNLLSYNYRSGLEIVETGNKIMGDNSALAKPLKTAWHSKIAIISVPNFNNYYNEINLEEDEKKNLRMMRRINEFFNSILKIIPENSTQSYFIMNRIRDLKFEFEDYDAKKSEVDDSTETADVMQEHKYRNYIPYSIYTFGRKIKALRSNVKIEANTVHQFKGREADVVIIINTINKLWPLLRGGKGDIIFNRTETDIENEERRLFYVAITRARHKVYLLTVDEEESEYIKKDGVYKYNIERL